MILDGQSGSGGVDQSGVSSEFPSGNRYNNGKLLLDEGYPPNLGFEGSPERSFLMEGQVIDRFSPGPNSRFFSPEGTPIGARSLNYAPNGQPVRFQVVKPFEVYQGKVLPWSGQPGGGTQYYTPLNLKTLLKHGIIRPY